MLEALIVLAVSLVAAVFAFLILRQVVLWYWKVNELVELLREISRKLDRQT